LNYDRQDLERLRSSLEERSIAETNVDGVLEQPAVQKDITALVDHLNPLRQSIPRKPGSGTEWLLNRRTAGSTVGAFYADTDTITEDTSTYARASFPYKTLATQGKVTRKAQAEGRSYTDILMDEITAKVDDFRDLEDQKLVNGDTGNDANSFEGIWELIPDTQMVAMTSAIGGTEVTLSKMDEFIDTNLGNVNMLLCSRAFRRQLESKLQSQQRFVNETEIAGGFRVMTYMGIPVLPTTSIPNTVYYNGSVTPTNSNFVGGTGATSVVLAVDFQHLWVGELTPFTVLPLAKASSQYDTFDMFEDITVVLNNTKKISALYNVSI
jgi:HK97 family phage major capsid protein